ncbi:MAG TPA: DUF1702 family protein [Solirubrobacteraceae bacterium]|nr:DUF1702 family protein [Solirubrobacteraceae bacterium]
MSPEQASERKGGSPSAKPPDAAPAAAPARLTARLRHRALSIGAREVSFDVRGFHTASSSARATLERHGGSFVAGFNAGLLAADSDDLARRLLEVPRADRGFAYEGSAMALGVLDITMPAGGGRLDRLLRSEHGQAHVYMLHVGAGWSLAQLRLRPRGHLRALDPFLRWLTVDGYGFHHGFFAPRRHVDACAVPRRARGYELRAFDQGLGRSLWFVVGGDVELAARTIGAFREDRHPDLWSGLGLAATYTTVADHDELVELGELVGDHRPQLAQGAAFAAAARHRAGNVVEHTRLAARVLCNRTVEELVAVTDDARHGLRGDAAGRDYELWRTRISEQLSGKPVFAR